MPAVVAGVLAAGVLGCGGGDPAPAGDGAARPDDFAISFEHVDGSVPPPHHHEWTLHVAADGAGKLAFTPDYPREGVPTYRSTFEVDPAALDALYEDLQAEGLLGAEIAPVEDPPVGGDTETATVTAGGESYEIPAFDASGSQPLDDVSAQVRDLVPEKTWRSFGRRGDDYAERVYGPMRRAGLRHDP